MRPIDLIPVPITDCFRLLRNRMKYPGRNISTPHISEGVVIGWHCTIGRNVALRAGVTIGDYSYVNAGTIIGSGEIGKFCSIAYYCQIGMADHPTDFISTSPYTYGKNNLFKMESIYSDYATPPVIGNDVWVGSNAVIRQGITIGDGAIIGAGSVVVKDVPPYTIVGGAPAKVIRSRFGPEIVEALLSIKWWNLSINELQVLEKHFAQGQQGPMSLVRDLASEL